MSDSDVLLAARALRDSLRGFEPGVFSGEDCATLATELAATEKACAAARARVAARAAACGAHKDKGFADPVEWMARETGSSSPKAKAELETAQALEGLADTKAAVESGELSMEQAREIARTEAEVPGSETELLGLARTRSLAGLKDAARKRRLGAVDPAELHARQRAARHVKHWRNDLGNVCGRFELAPEVGIPFVNRLDAETGRVRRAARRAGSTEAWEAHAADAFARLVAGTGTGTGSGRGRPGQVELVIVVDLAAWRRGHAHPGEVCHLLGGGPVPVELARELGRDAFLKAVLHDGVAIHTVAHFGRHVPAHLRTALDLGPLPDRDGVTCSEPGCDRRYGLEWDHTDPVANNGPTSYENLKPKCRADHAEKTRRDREAGLTHKPRPAPARDGPDTP